MTRSSSAGRAVAFVAGALLVPACIVHEGEPHPLYPDSEKPRPASEVARLFGPIATVDGQDVSRLGKSFSLLPGCHTIRLAEKVGEMSTSNSGGYVGTIGTVIFAIWMKANHVYEIEIQVRNVTGPVGRLMIQAWERPSDGSSARAIAPARTDQDFEDCRQGPP